MADTYSNLDVTRLGAQDGTTNPLELFKVEYGLQVMKNFRENLNFTSATKVKTISNSKGYEWPLLSEVTAKYHTPGARVASMKPVRGNRTIYIDDTIVSAVEVDEIDKLMNHTDEMSQYSEKQGYELAKIYDLAVAAEVIKGALVAPSSDDLVKTTNIGKGGNYLETKIDSATDPAAALLAAILQLGQSLDEKQVPRRGRTLALKPKYYWLLFNNIDLINSLHPGIGNIANGTMMKVAGFNIIESTNFPTVEYML
jgi:hypothetical protein